MKTKFRILLSAVLFVSAVMLTISSPVRAQQPTSPTYVDHSATLTTANVSQQIAPVEAWRHGIFIQNVSTTDTIYINFTSAAVVGGAGSIALGPLQTFTASTLPSATFSSATIEAIDFTGPTVGDIVTCKTY